jgi:hypothetical protein
MKNPILIFLCFTEANTYSVVFARNPVKNKTVDAFLNGALMNFIYG